MEDNDIITCEVASSVRTKTIFVKLSPQSTVRDLLDKIADRYSKPRDFFSLYFVVNLSEPNESDNDNICLDDMENQKLEALLPDHKQDCAKFLIKWHRTDSNELANKAENMEQLLLSQGSPLPEIISPLELPTCRESANNRLGMVGLVNQAMTCYLNSLLQSLFMTPEFRNAIYRWKFSGSQVEGWKSISFQLQRLFLQLQTSKKKSIPTTNITQSFGWDTSDAWQQHDVQELCRVMFDALEKTWKDTDQSNLINELYQGKMKDFIQCSECGWQSTKYVAYQDIPLVVKPFGSDKAYASVEESLDGFCAPELLDGNNQWFCENCQKKVNAKKCLKFMTFPYILTFHFMRFGFDYTTMRRIKLNNRVTFPEVLNVDRYISETGEQDAGSREQKDSSASNENKRSGGDCSAEQRNYELFSIMIHSGNANGGHYYAYIKSFDTGQWYNFDDQSVTKISHDEIHKTFGGSSSPPTYYLPMFASSTNAYMIMYRKIDKKQNAGFMKIEEFPSYLKEVLMNIEEEEEQVRKKQEIEKSCCKIKIFMFHPISNKLLESLLVININKTLKEATDLSWELFELEGIISRDCVRLVQYDSDQDYIEQSFHSFDENVVSLYELLGGSKSWYSFDLLLETKSPNNKFESYHVGEWVLRVHPVYLEREEILPHLSIRVNPRATVRETCRLIMARFQSSKYLDPLMLDETENCVNHVPVLPLELIEENHNSSFEESQSFDTNESEFHADVCRAILCFPPSTEKENQFLSNWQILLHVKNEFVRLQNFHKQIKNEGFSKISNLYVNCSRTDVDAKKVVTTSSFYNFLKRHHNQITVKVSFEKCLNWNGGNLSKQPECNGKEPQNSVEIKKLDEENYPSMDGDTLDSDFVCQSLNSAEMMDDQRSTNGHDRKECFKVEFLTPQHCSGIRECLVTFDKRIRVRTFKELIRPHVGIQDFELHKVLVGMCPDERLMRSIENFTLFENNSQIRIKAGRDLKKNEFLLKIYQLDICKAEVINFLFESILTKGITVAEVKILISNFLQKRDKIHISPNHIRIRKKIWKNPTAVLDDCQKFDDIELFVTYNSEIFVQFLTEPDPQGNDKRYIFVRRWWPSKYQLDPVQEIITKRSIIDFINKISELSSIEAENIQISKVSGMFPNETPLLDIHTGLVWLPYQNDEVNLPETALESLDIYSDGTMFYYRDKTESLKHLNQEEKNGILQKCKIFPSIARKEKALKIYMESAVSTPVNSDS